MLRTRALALPLLLVLTLAGCGSPPLPRALGSPSVSNTEAVSVATAIYAELTRTSDAIGAQGGQGAEALIEFASGEFLDSSLDGFRTWPDLGWRQVGVTHFRDVALVSVSAAKPLVIRLELCHDFTGVDVIDATGSSVINAGGPNSSHFLVELSASPSGTLKVTSRSLLDAEPC